MSDGEHSWSTTLRKNWARLSNSLTSATSTWLSEVIVPRSALLTTCGPDTATSRWTLAALLSAAPTPTTSTRVPADLMALARMMARLRVNAAAAVLPSVA